MGARCTPDILQSFSTQSTCFQAGLLPFTLETTRVRGLKQASFSNWPKGPHRGDRPEPVGVGRVHTLLPEGLAGNHPQPSPSPVEPPLCWAQHHLAGRSQTGPPSQAAKGHGDVGATTLGC